MMFCNTDLENKMLNYAESSEYNLPQKRIDCMSASRALTTKLCNKLLVLSHSGWQAIHSVALTAPTDSSH